MLTTAGPLARTGSTQIAAGSPKPNLPPPRSSNTEPHTETKKTAKNGEQHACRKGKADD